MLFSIMRHDIIVHHLRGKTGLNGRESYLPSKGGDDLRDYELMYILSPEITDEVVSGDIERVNQIIVSRGGTVTEVNPWGRRKLAYPIGKFAEGNYVLTQLKLDAKNVADLEATLRIDEDIMRHLLIRVGE